MSASTTSLQWAGGGGNVLAQRFPSFQFDPEDVMSGKVKVFARSPSGRMQPMDVLDADGLFNANFTPDEVGDWVVSILYEGRNIEGSPFNVRVYDPGQIRVIGLDGSLASRNYTFSVDASRAGQGPLIIDIMYNGQLIPAQIAPDPHRDKQFNVKFKPRGPGYYTVRVFFSDIEITGSPFTVEVMDPGTVIAQGQGLISAQAHHQAIFTVCTDNAAGVNVGDCRITIYDPRGMQIASNVMDQHDGSIRVEFVPVTVGDHKIDIKYCGRPITGSPFMCRVSDCAQISVSNLCNVTRCGKCVEFDVNAVNAGQGDLEITVNGGTVPCTVQPRGNRLLHASFTPRVAIPHDVEITFNGQEVAGSPWRVNVMNPAQITVVGADNQLMPVNVPAWFEIRGAVASADGDLVVNIMSPCKKMVRSTMTCVGNGIYRVEYTPTEVGVYSIEVIYDCTAVPCSPFTSKAYDASAIKCGPVPLAFVDKPVEFNVDVSRAGESQTQS